MITKKNVNKYLKIILSSLWWCAIILLALLLINITASKMRGEVPKVFGYSIMYITTGSMEDEIPIGSYILIKEVRPEEVKQDDIICFYSEDPLIYGYPNTHRVVEDPVVTEDGYEYVTRGDANSKNDPINAKSDRLIGRYVKRLSALSEVLDFVTTKYMLLVIAAIQLGFAVMIFYTALINIKKKNGAGKKELSEEDIARLKAEAIAEIVNEEATKNNKEKSDF